MRGAYTATYLARVACAFASRRGVGSLDVGRAFDLIVGTSVGGIVGCALAAGVPLERIIDLFHVHGPSIFRRKLPARISLSLVVDLARRPRALHQGTEALRSALAECFREETLAEVYKRRHIALAITAVELSQHRSWVFKTAHQAASNHRDDNYLLVDVCLATSAAPLYRSLASLPTPDGEPATNWVFADGGLWANNPVLVGLIEALGTAEQGRPIQVFCLGTCPRPAGELVPQDDLHRGLPQWQFGGHIATLAIDAQEFAFDNMARMLTRHLDRPCEVLRFPSDRVPAAMMPYLDLDETRPEAIEALIKQARTDADMANSMCADPKNAAGRLICELFADLPELTTKNDQHL